MREAATVLLGTWPQQVSGWGKSGIAAFLGQLGARGMTASEAVAAIQTCDDRFPPSAGELAAMRSIPALTSDDVVRAIFDGPRCVLKARPPYTGPILEPEKQRDKAAIERASGIDPLLGAFVAQQLRWLRSLEVDHPEYGELNRKEARRAWSEFVTNREGRDIAALTSGRGPGELRQLNPLSAIAAGPAAQITKGA
jgi:hypothetical protein